MDDLFRFMALRAAERVDSGAGATPEPPPEQPAGGSATPPRRRARRSDLVDLATGDKFQVALAAIHTTPPHQDGRPPLPSALATPSRVAVRRMLAATSETTGHRPRPLPPPEGTHPTPPPDVLARAQHIVEQYITGAFGPGFIADDVELPWAAACAALAAAAPTLPDRTALTNAITALFGAAPATLAADARFADLRRDLADTIVAVILHPGVHALPLSDLAQAARCVHLIDRCATNDATLDLAGAIGAAFNATLLLPESIFPLRADLPQPVGVGDLLVVRQQLKRYEPGDVANIENILRGEARKKLTGHSLTHDDTTINTTSKTTETQQSLEVTERFGLKTETANVVREDIAAHAGMSVSAKYGPVQINANANVAYNLSKEQSGKVATEHAKDVTTRAATRVTESVQRQEIARTIEKFSERERHSFDNTAGGAHVSGVYQWVNKVYEAQVWNYGKRLLFDLVIPEPAAFLRDALRTQETRQVAVAPQPFVAVLDTPNGQARPVRASDLGPDGQIRPGVLTRPITPADLKERTNEPFYYGHYAGLYAAPGINAPPERFTTVAKAYTANKDEQNHLALADTLTIPQGYQAYRISVQGGFTLYEEEDGDERMWVFVGKHRFECKGRGNLLAAAAFLPLLANQENDEQGTIPVAVETQQARDFAITIDILCSLTAAAFTQWQLDTHASLLTAYARLQGDYEDQKKALAMQRASARSLGNNPAQNRIIERTELKKAAIARLAATDLVAAGFDDIELASSGPAFPRPNVPPRRNPAITGGDQGAFARFFEQAFEWEHLMVVYYPYYWGRQSNWYDAAVADNPDPLFAEFLKAGAARVVVPVRPQLEGDLRYFLMTGQIWGGGAMPGITDSDYLPITEEIRARDDAPGSEVPQGEPWDVTLPTTLIRLREDDTLPMWRKFLVTGRLTWVPGRITGGVWVPDYGTLDTAGNWTPP